MLQKRWMELIKNYYFVRNYQLGRENSVVDALNHKNKIVLDELVEYDNK